MRSCRVTRAEELDDFIVAWTMVWAALAIALIIFWFELPKWVSWPLVVVEAIMV